MLEQDGEAGKRVLSPAEAQQGEGLCKPAMHNNSPTYDPSVPKSVFVPFSQEEKEKKWGQKAEVRKTAGIPPTLGGGERTASK